MRWIRWLITALILGSAAVLWWAGAMLKPPEAVITWSTESEVETAGFHVYRATQEEGPYEQVSTELIPSQGDPFTGGEYTFRDPTIQAGQSYFYQLEELETTGNFVRLPDTVRFEAATDPLSQLSNVRLPVALPLLGALIIVWLLPEPRRHPPAPEAV